MRVKTKSGVDKTADNKTESAEAQDDCICGDDCNCGGDNKTESAEAWDNCIGGDDCIW